MTIHAVTAFHVWQGRPCEFTCPSASFARQAAGGSNVVKLANHIKSVTALSFLQRILSQYVPLMVDANSSCCVLSHRPLITWYLSKPSHLFVSVQFLLESLPFGLVSLLAILFLWMIPSFGLYLCYHFPCSMILQPDWCIILFSRLSPISQTWIPR